ncbi:sulfate adenylyltransferase subunit 1 [Gillisia mitskevichiae]|uniref:sulfate adenylyltransferase n=1 Tax=Gillisia mitskevichiae TaxID=270921 RepID=A0A495PZZ3_9FLAO|nr:GTP-binding protein [Gillisia mitskevichiae]RKS56125.1 sulfate adenylyltransferase subunit 1 [Gillisia mitskevichiae]
MEVLKIATAGSVDDGKSTLIGRLLYDTKSLTSDKLEAIEKSSRKKGLDYLDFSLATDGLVAEREQGITIDVAHIYFSTQRKSYIIADTPGHVEYTRNMVTGASTSQVSIILIDARKGVIEQTQRHFFINNLLRLKEVVVAVNKMDLVNYSEDVFNEIVSDFKKIQKESEYNDQKVTFIPVSALWGENIADVSSNMGWYQGNTILDYLENIKAEDFQKKTQSRFPVQTVIRPKTEDHRDFRAYAGKLSGGNLKVGESITVLPSLTSSKVKEIYFFDKEYAEASSGSSITITLEDDINITRGDTLVKSDEIPKCSKTLISTICWMDSKSMLPSAKYLLQHNTNRILTKIDHIESISLGNYDTGEINSNLQLNQIGQVSMKLSKLIYADTYENNPENGRFILIDPITNTTAGVGFIDSL